MPESQHKKSNKKFLEEPIAYFTFIINWVFDKTSGTKLHYVVTGKSRK
jgi:hypothetical protein